MCWAQLGFHSHPPPGPPSSSPPAARQRGTGAPVHPWRGRGEGGRGRRWGAVPWVQDPRGADPTRLSRPPRLQQWELCAQSLPLARQPPALTLPKALAVQGGCDGVRPLLHGVPRCRIRRWEQWEGVTLLPAGGKWPPKKGPPGGGGGRGPEHDGAEGGPEESPPLTCLGTPQHQSPLDLTPKPRVCTPTPHPPQLGSVPRACLCPTLAGRHNPTQGAPATSPASPQAGSASRLAVGGSWVLPRSSQGLDKGPWGVWAEGSEVLFPWEGAPSPGSPFCLRDMPAPLPPPRRTLGSGGAEACSRRGAAAKGGEGGCGWSTPRSEHWKGRWGLWGTQVLSLLSPTARPGGQTPPESHTGPRTHGGGPGSAGPQSVVGEREAPGPRCPLQTPGTSAARI